MPQQQAYILGQVVKTRFYEAATYGHNVNFGDWDVEFVRGIPNCGSRYTYNHSFPLCSFFLVKTSPLCLHKCI